jgi:hypothetical protein
MSGWDFFGACAEGQRFEIEGVNVWDQEWVRSNRETADVLDPLYGQRFHFAVYEISVAGKPAAFAAGEFSNCMWGFYIRI